MYWSTILLSTVHLLWLGHSGSEECPLNKMDNEIWKMTHISACL